jgi:hypothetical protein
MNPVYFETHFRCTEASIDWPGSFAIVTAYATTGETWSAAENQAADQALEADLRKRSAWIRRLTGYSPSTGHAEPGWAVEIDFATACDVGLQFKQEAIYFVVGDTLSVSYCDTRRAPLEVGGFRERVQMTDAR